MRYSLFFFCWLLVDCAGSISPPSFAPNAFQSTADIQETPNTPLRLVIFDVGQGDAALLITPSQKAILIDGGPPAAGKNIILPYLATMGISTIDLIIASHNDLDHVGGIPEMFAGFDGEAETPDDILPAEGCIRADAESGANLEIIIQFHTLMETCARSVNAGDRITFEDGVMFTIMAINGHLSSGDIIESDVDDENAKSIALLIEYGAFRYFTAGDLPGGGGNPPYQTLDAESLIANDVGDIDILHVGHHGSTTSSNAYFLDSLTPEMALISVGDGNTYFHPHDSVISRLLEREIMVYQTERGWLDAQFLDAVTVMNGPIMIESDGDGYWVIDE